MSHSLSDEESYTSEEEINPRNDKRLAEKHPEQVKYEGEGDEYIVEKILTHKFEKGTLKFLIKWLGYEAKSDQTWEPEKNLFGCKELVDEYFDTIGGRPSKGTAVKKRKPSLPPKQIKDAQPDLSTRKRVKTEDQFVTLAASSWEDRIRRIETIEETIDPKTGEPKRWVYVTWKDGQKTKHDLPTLHQRAPQTMLQYYEQHLIFKTRSADVMPSQATSYLSASVGTDSDE